MKDLTNLEQTIRERLAASKARTQAQQQALRQDMEERERRTANFKSLGRHLWEKVVHPRCEKLASLFPHARLDDFDDVLAHRAICRFGHVPQYPASTNLTLGISADAAVKNVILNYDLEILPIFFKYKGHDQLVVPLEAVNEAAIANWVEAKLLEFTDAYLQLQTVEQYQRGNLVTDPVCGMQINSAAAAAQTVYEGKTYYFCVEQCHQKFLMDPAPYVAGPKE